MVSPPGGVTVIFKLHQLGFAMYLEVGLANETEIFDHGTLNLCFVLCSGMIGEAFPALNVSICSNKFDFEQETLCVVLAALEPKTKLKVAKVTFNQGRSSGYIKKRFVKDIDREFKMATHRIFPFTLLVITQGSVQHPSIWILGHNINKKKNCKGH